MYVGYPQVYTIRKDNLNNSDGHTNQHRYDLLALTKGLYIHSQVSLYHNYHAHMHRTVFSYLSLTW